MTSWFNSWSERCRSFVVLLLLVLTAACGGGSSGSFTTSPESGSASESNVLPVIVERGPYLPSVNLAFVDVTVCVPDTNRCQTVEHVILDTASYGLRLFASALPLAQDLPAVRNRDQLAVAECAHFFNGVMWGSVKRADVLLAGEAARQLPVHIIADPAALYAQVPEECASIGYNIGSPWALNANGILGIGLTRLDCPLCAELSSLGVYYACQAGACTSISLPGTSQVANPVTAFALDNNGFVIRFPALPAGGAPRLAGEIVFGIGTRPNNTLGIQTVYPADDNGHLSTTYKGVVATTSLLDTGSNGIFFKDDGIPACASGFYCPVSTLLLEATLASASSAASDTVRFTVENADLFPPSMAVAHVAGYLGDPDLFIWGLPFFLGRSVAGAIGAVATPHGTGPYWAF